MKKRDLPAGMHPRLLTRAQAAAYCQVSEPIFTAKCPVVPVRMGESARLARWDKHEIDRWLDSLSGVSWSGVNSWLDRLSEGSKHGEDPGARPENL
jgi:hypothetical protein